jgi:hypothetical protein
MACCIAFQVDPHCNILLIRRDVNFMTCDSMYRYVYIVCVCRATEYPLTSSSSAKVFSRYSAQHRLTQDNPRNNVPRQARLILYHNQPRRAIGRVIYDIHRSVVRREVGKETETTER